MILKGDFIAMNAQKTQTKQSSNKPQIFRNTKGGGTFKISRWEKIIKIRPKINDIETLKCNYKKKKQTNKP